MTSDLHVKLRVHGPGFDHSVDATFVEVDDEFSLTAPKSTKLRHAVYVKGKHELRQDNDYAFVYSGEQLLARFKTGIRDTPKGHDYFLRRIE
jgi:hypothetical protein